MRGRSYRVIADLTLIAVSGATVWVLFGWVDSWGVAARSKPRSFAGAVSIDEAVAPVSISASTSTVLWDGPVMRTISRSPMVSDDLVSARLGEPSTPNNRTPTPATAAITFRTTGTLRRTPRWSPEGADAIRP